MKRSRIASLFVSLVLLVAGCNSGFRVPPAAMPQLLSTGLQVNASSGPVTIGSATPFCGNDFTLRQGPNGRGLYVTVKMPPLNLPEVTYAGTRGDYWGSLTDPAQQSLTQGPRPVTQQQIQNLQGNYVGYFVHDDHLVGSDYQVVIGILLGQGVPEGGALEIRSVNNDPHNTGLQARSDPLVIRIAAPVRVSASISPSSVTEGQPFTLSWNAANADSVQITGSGAPAGSQPTSGSLSLTSGCAGDRDATTASFQVRGLRNGCPSATMTQTATVTVNAARRITQFEGLPNRPFENASFELAWNAPGATGVTITGPNNLSRTDSRSQGRITVTAPSIPACVVFFNFNYQLTATFPSCGPRTATTLVSVFAPTLTFDLVESGGSGCLSTHFCRVVARTRSEARQCATCPIQQGCSWQ